MPTLSQSGSANSQELSSSLPPNVSTSSSAQLAPHLSYHTMSVIGSGTDYNDDKFFKDLTTLEKPYEIPKDYEEV
jgi:hypothetical protein